MLNLFADALLIATRMEPRHTDHGRRRPDPAEDTARRRRWFSLAGLRV
jgi:hypothetical protein